ncbi:MAG: ABC transporter ATP-binding protein [Gammaproteobacteria bacterium]|nr:ABC transporter ATP-binding protein [Gammaproteobacteria bacterium]
MAKELIQLVSLSKSYREGNSRRTVFHSLDAEFFAGDFVCITGRSGSGKSTLLNLISGIDLPDSGEIRLDGQDIGALGDGERTLIRRRKIGFVFQFFNLIPTLTVAENLRLPLELNRESAEGAEQKIEELVSRVGLSGREDSYPESLSGGEQQRVAIARALIHRPRIILADEPTGNLDQETGRDVLELMARMVREEGATMLMVSHSVEAARWADRLLRIDAGALSPVDGMD